MMHIEELIKSVAYYERKGLYIEAYEYAQEVKTMIPHIKTQYLRYLEKEYAGFFKKYLKNNPFIETAHGCSEDT